MPVPVPVTGVRYNSDQQFWIVFFIRDIRFNVQRKNWSNEN